MHYLTQILIIWGVYVICVLIINRIFRGDKGEDI